MCDKTIIKENFVDDNMTKKETVKFIRLFPVFCRIQFPVNCFSVKPLLNVVFCKYVHWGIVP